MNFRSLYLVNMLCKSETILLIEFPVTIEYVSTSLNISSIFLVYNDFSIATVMLPLSQRVNRISGSFLINSLVVERAWTISLSMQLITHPLFKKWLTISIERFLISRETSKSVFFYFFTLFLICLMNCIIILSLPEIIER